MQIRRMPRLVLMFAVSNQLLAVALPSRLAATGSNRRLPDRDDDPPPPRPVPSPTGPRPPSTASPTVDPCFDAFNAPLTQDGWWDDDFGHASLNCLYELVDAAAVDDENGADNSDAVSTFGNTTFPDLYTRAYVYAWCAIEHLDSCHREIRKPIAAYNYEFGGSKQLTFPASANITIILRVLEGYHDYAIESGSGYLAKTAAATSADGTVSLTFDSSPLPVGSIHNTMCTIGDHKTRGMVGTIRILPTDCPCHTNRPYWSREQCASELYTLMGFASRKSPPSSPHYNLTASLEYYDTALALDPANCAARAYRIELFLQIGDRIRTEEAAFGMCNICNRSIAEYAFHAFSQMKGNGWTIPAQCISKIDSATSEGDDNGSLHNISIGESLQGTVPQENGLATSQGDDPQKNVFAPNESAKSVSVETGQIEKQDNAADFDLGQNSEASSMQQDSNGAHMHVHNLYLKVLIVFTLVYITQF